MASAFAPSRDAEGAFPPLGKNLKALLVWPKIPNSFWTFTGMMELLPEKVVMPPLGLITVAALCPENWTLRLVDQGVEELTDDDILWADLVMASAMTVQRDGLQEVLARARRLGRRTMVGGPYASGEPARMLAIADHVVVGEPDEVFGEIARGLEEGTARRLYEIADKPDVTRTPAPRFDLLNLDCYASMSVQFSRGCPFQCEFCDIIILYGPSRAPSYPHRCWPNSTRCSAWAGESKSSWWMTTSSAIMREPSNSAWSSKSGSRRGVIPSCFTPKPPWTWRANPR